MQNQNPPGITPLEMSEADIALAEKAAKRIGYTQTAYTSTSGLWGLFCLPDNARHRGGCFIKTEQFGIMFVQDLEDLHCEDLKPDPHAWLNRHVAEQSPQAGLVSAACEAEAVIGLEVLDR